MWEKSTIQMNTGDGWAKFFECFYIYFIHDVVFITFHNKAIYLLILKLMNRKNKKSRIIVLLFLIEKKYYHFRSEIKKGKSLEKKSNTSI